MFIELEEQGRVLDYAIEIGVLSNQEGKDIWHKNVLNWLGIKKENFIK